MSLALAALVVVLGQTGGKVEVIKGKKNAGAQKPVKVIYAPDANPEISAQPIIDKSKPNPDAKPNPAQGTSGDAQADAQLQKEQSAEEKAKADKQKAQQQKQIEKISADNQKLWQQSADALAGDTNTSP